MDVSIGAQASGIAQGAINECIKWYVKERVQFGKRISQFQNTQFELADMQTKGSTLLASCCTRLLVVRTRTILNWILFCPGKLGLFLRLLPCYRRCLQLVGGMGYTREFPFERFMRDAKITEIYEGTPLRFRRLLSLVRWGLTNYPYGKIVS